LSQPRNDPDKKRARHVDEQRGVKGVTHASARDHELGYHEAGHSTESRAEADCENGAELH
jgi:YD repeat-containing protein